MKKTVIHLNPYPAQGAINYFPQNQVIGDMAVALEGIHKQIIINPEWNHDVMFKAAIAMQESIQKSKDSDAFPVDPGYIISALRSFMDDHDILSLDNGVHMVWASRNYGAYEPNTMLIDHALGSMGISLPAAIAAKLVHPERKVVVVTGDGGFMMNSQELETATRLNLDLIVCIFNDSSLGMIDLKQKSNKYGNIGVDLINPDFIKYAESFGAKGYRLESSSEFPKLLKKAESEGGVHIIDIPIDKKQNMMLLKEMKAVDCGAFI